MSESKTYVFEPSGGLGSDSAIIAGMMNGGMRDERGMYGERRYRR